MRKITLLMLLILVLLSSNLVQAKDKPTLTWGYWQGAEPINWVENGVPKGIEVEIVQYVMDQLGIEVEHKFLPWARVQQYVKEGKIDGMITTPNNGRFEYAVFGKEVAMPNYWNIFVRKDNYEMIEKIKKFDSLEDMKPYKLVDFIGNGWSMAFMKKEDGYNINRVSGYQQLPRLLAKGRCDFLINSSNWIRWWAKKQGLLDQFEEIHLELPLTEFEFTMMISRKSPWLDKGIIKAMDEELKKMKASGEWHKILKKYENLHGHGRPFNSQLVTDKYYTNYETYPEWKGLD